jgi:uncharacterized protein involved in high-affinity Fe2+ transport
MLKSTLAALTAVAVLTAQSAVAAVIPIGQELKINGLVIKPLFIQAVKVEGEIPKDLQQPGGPTRIGEMPMDPNMKMAPKEEPKAGTDTEAKPAEGDAMAGMQHGGHGHHMGRADADIHLEVAVHADKDNPHGFKEGSWIPYLKIFYEIEKKGDRRWFAAGTMIPMASSDGPHYGDNAKLNGPGKYRIKFSFWPPTIPYHTDRETGVDGWWVNFQQEWEFSFFGAGKKGGY